MAIGLRFRGLVQGVGFRPTVWHVARELGLKGDVRNDGDGVWVRFRGGGADADAFCQALYDRLPPLARIDEIERHDGLEDFVARAFDIHHSDQTTPLTGIVPDAATCPACLAELADRTNRRYRYPFINCTHCGPRLSIIRAIPYDRPNTSMSVFPLCSSCEQEYADPADRRYHAQPNACGDCGPRVWIAGENDGTDPFESAQRTLRAGGILALKGIGGFHLACDAHDEQAVNSLRERKKRYGKPFALMARDLDSIGRYVHLSDQDAELLQSPAAPIVLMDRRADAPTLPDSVAMEHGTLGFMLPYSPIHHLLLEHWDGPLIMTSGNLSDEPQCIDNHDAADRLHTIADKVLLHDREIVNRVDDSVIRPMAGGARFYRRARGYAPAPILLHDSFRDCPPVLALGGELKSTICLLENGRATVSQHLGDLEDVRTSDEFERTTRFYRDIFAFEARTIAVDQHPDYRSTRFGEQLAAQEGTELLRIQHHHAHIASVMAENGLPIDTDPVLGIALDGLGYGSDGTIWGGEFLKADFKGFTRLGHIATNPMPGGTQAILEPWRNLWAQLHTQGLWADIAKRHADQPIIKTLQAKPLTVLENMVDRGLNSPLTSSAGRLFDAMAAALSLHHERVYQEGQAAIALEQLAARSRADDRCYPFERREENGLMQLNTRSLWPAVFADLSAGVGRSAIARGFHEGLVAGVNAMAMALADRHGLHTVALSGGVFQNRLLLEGVVTRLESAGLRVIQHGALPANDGGLCLGQAAIAARIRER